MKTSGNVRTVNAGGKYSEQVINELVADVKDLQKIAITGDVFSHNEVGEDTQYSDDDRFSAIKRIISIVETLHSIVEPMMILKNRGKHKEYMSTIKDFLDKEREKFTDFKESYSDDQILEETYNDINGQLGKTINKAGFLRVYFRISNLFVMLISVFHLAGLLFTVNPKQKFWEYEELKGQFHNSFVMGQGVRIEAGVRHPAKRFSRFSVSFTQLAKMCSERRERQQDTLIIVVGERGAGKSTWSLKFCRRFPEFNMSRDIIYSRKNFFDALSDKDRILFVDEAIATSGKNKSSTKGFKEIFDKITIGRSNRNTTVLCLPSIDDLTSKILQYSHLVVLIDSVGHASLFLRNMNTFLTLGQGGNLGTENRQRIISKFLSENTSYSQAPSWVFNEYMGNMLFKALHPKLEEDYNKIKDNKKFADYDNIDKDEEVVEDKKYGGEFDGDEYKAKAVDEEVEKEKPRRINKAGVEHYENSPDGWGLPL